MYSYTVRPGSGWELFLATHLPRMFRGSAETPWAWCNPAGQQWPAKAERQMRKVPPPSPHRVPAPRHTTQLLAGDLCVSRLRHLTRTHTAPPVISFPTFAGKTQPRANMVVWVI